MSNKTAQALVISNLRAGRNGTDPSFSLADDECADAVNVDWFNTMLARRRAGAAAGVTTSNTWTGTLSWLGRFVPSGSLTSAELWASDDAATPILNRLSGVTWSAPTLKDAPTGVGANWDSASCNGKFFLAYKSGQDRMHVWDGSTVRRAGLPTPAVPTVADGVVGGTYPAILRYYRIRWTVQAGGITTRRSEPSVSVSFTPVGTKTTVVVTQSTVPGEGETHWEVEASPDNVNFFLLSTTVIATTTYADSTAVTAYNLGTASAAIGTYTPQTSSKYLAFDQNRVLGFGNYTTTNKQNRIEVSAVVGSLNVSDEERVTATIDLDELDSGAAAGIGGPVAGSFFAWKEHQTWKLTPSGNAGTPYTAIALSKVIGAIDARAHCVGEDEHGNPCIYWMSHRGPYRFGSMGFQYIGHGVEDLVIGPTSTIDPSATVVSTMVYYPDKRQVWVWFATTGNTYPNVLLIYQVGRQDIWARFTGDTAKMRQDAPSGWARFTGDITKARASVLFATTIAASNSRAQSPYLAYGNTTKTFYKCDTGTTDNGTTYQAYIDSKVYHPFGLARNGTINRCHLLAKAAAGVTIRQTITPDYGADTARTSDVVLTAAGSESRVIKRFEDAAMGDVGAVQFRWGDPAAIDVASWQLDSVVAEQVPAEER